MSGLATPLLTISQLKARPRPPHRRHWWGRLWQAVALWRRRVRERQALAKLTPYELADFGATTADVYRELNTPFWRSLPPKD